MHTNILYKSFPTPCKADKSVQFKTAAYQGRIWGAAKIFPHEALKVMESQDQRLHGVHQEHWQEYQALHRLAHRGNASTLTCQRKSQKKKAYECSKTESQREWGYPHIAAIMRLLSTLTEPWAFIQGGDVPWRKEHCTLSKKILNSTQGNKLGWHAGLVHSDKSKMPYCVCTWLKTNCF